MNGPHFAAPAAPAQQPTPRPARPAPKPADRNRADAAPAMMVFTYLRLHWLMILFCGTLLGSGLAYLAWTLLPSKYESYALIQVASAPPTIADQGDPNRNRTAFGTYVKTTAQLLKSDFVLSRALGDERYRIAQLPTLKDQKDPIKFLDEKLQIGYSEGSELVRISLEGDRPEDLAKIVNAVKDAYFKEVIDKDRDKSTQLLAVVKNAKSELIATLERKVGVPGQKDGELAQGNKKQPTPPGGVMQIPTLPGAGPEIIQTGVPPTAPAATTALSESDAIKRMMLPYLVQKKTRLEDEITFRHPIAVKEQTEIIESLKKRLTALTHGAPSAEVMKVADNDPEVKAAEAKAKKLWGDYSYLRKVAQNPNDPKILRIKAQAEAADQEAEKLKREKAVQMETGHRQDKADDLIKQIDVAQRNLSSLQEKHRVNQAQLKDVQQQIAQTPPPEVRKGEERGPLVNPEVTDLTTLNGVLASLIAHEVRLTYELKSPPRVYDRQSASAPAQKDPKKQILATVFAGLMGFGLIGFGAVAYEMRAKKVSSLVELKTTGPTAVIGEVPWAPDGSIARDPVKRADVNEAIDKLRAYVAQTWLARGATTVAVTSPLGDEGKAFTAFGLASSLAQAGYKTLLVDFDLRNPSLHPYAGVANGTGVCELLRGEADPRGAVVALPNGLNVLPAGKWSDEARQAAVGGRLETLLSRLREPFDCVVLHGHALLTVAESVEIARRSEVVLLCTLYRETRLPLLKRAAERLTAMEVPYSGVVYLGATSNEALC
jgi:Mrp family chromosome partitioning ATPase/capsular polysaccharide biosynthesis protein